MKRVSVALVAGFLAVACTGSDSNTPPIAPERPQTPDDLTLVCTDGVVLTKGAYRAENNTWGKGPLTGWSQCIGLGAASDTSVTARFTWNWPESGTNVKAYPELIFGRKPAGPTSTPLLPRLVSELRELSVQYDLTSVHTGSGNTAFDIWLTDTTDPTSFSVPPITHEIMVWLESYGSLTPAGTLRERTTIGGIAYDVFVGDGMGAGWRYVAFRCVDATRNAGTIDLLSLLAYAAQSHLIAGSEYLASIEFGNEVVSGMGETKINAFAVSVQ